jgi:long-chain acyl-CoA synthetase
MQIVRGPRYFPARSFTTLREMLDQSAELYGNRVAFRFREQLRDDPVTRTYRDFQSETAALGTALLELGLAGRRLAVVGENSYSWCLAHVAIVNGIGVSIPLDRMLPEDEMLGLLARGEVDAVFYDAPFHQVMIKAAAALPCLRSLICLRPDRLKAEPPVGWTEIHGSPASRPDPAAGPVFYRLPDMLAAGRSLLELGDQRYRQRSIDPEALASLLFTSGTTSAAKAVMLSHRNICADIKGLAGVVKLPSGIRMLSVLPLHHTFENTCGLFMALYVGAEIHECDGLRHIQKNMQEYGIDMIIGVPLLFNNFYEKVQDSLKKAGKDQLVRRLIPMTQVLRRFGIDLRRIAYRRILQAFGGRFKMGICGAAPIDPAIIRFFDAIGVRILEGYGLTETAPVASGCNSRLFFAGTVGQPLTGMEIAVESETPGEPGEILIRGENVMLGYYRDPAATAEAIDADGWFHSGDIGRLDPRTSCLIITGRVKSMIVLKNGKKVFPEEIEYLISQAGFVKESLVWGEIDPDGEVVISAKLVVDREAVQKHADQAMDDRAVRQRLEQLIQEINARLPSFKSIRQFVFSFQEMVKTTTLKIRRPVEIARIGELMASQKLKWREMSGCNLDTLTTSQPNPHPGSSGAGQSGKGDGNGF